MVTRCMDYKAMNILTRTIKWWCNKSAFINMNKCYDPITSPCTIIIQLLFYSALQMFRNKKDYGLAFVFIPYNIALVNGKTSHILERCYASFVNSMCSYYTWTS